MLPKDCLVLLPGTWTSFVVMKEGCGSVEALGQPRV